ncbi:hypothetical protein EN904_22010 [Mesorhizobium sp. M7A.F.Ca.CA.001.07.2.1]|uniref:hypothetical protein n=1 Tax=Mesorhizobium TaxID=68287 RepID=UPI000FCB15E8|nr:MULTISPECIES: hypothetical protein [Mesorhizobium]RVB36747.1 hypothetical protein EN918_15580 [Mesorhizobium sp. M7A.F.Ca.CA.004.05.1.1]MCF6124746.1 hypothetical protein [Mesorhizobium ciceri]MCQ8814165.1 hypothetical protein [Mesorhizobium sp. SEMIA396]RUX72491.1 hypothetical protein EN983_21975 [Mesorhizobium sp. M7A.F.Ca.CA.004.08.2.1]RUX83731.1 hypothetical protein EN982_26040 [Mesorhizobium sp. M7A.F.Ca.CA.004.08.1.1]
MELHYLTPKIRRATIDGKAATKMLGEDLARSYHSLIADMRGAIYLHEVPDEPKVNWAEGKIGLSYPLGDSAVVEVEPIGAGVIDTTNWGDVHRVKLLRILNNGKLLA